MTGSLILLSSYPKSGNTWTRAIFEQLRRGPGWKFSINEMRHGYYGFTRRTLFDAVAPVNAADLFADEVDDMLPQIFRTLVAENPEQIIVKVHDDSRRTKSGGWLYPPEIVSSVIYLVRHPFDVAVSFANHMSLALPDAVALMQDGEAVSDLTDELALPLPQHLGSWTSNIESWLDSSPYPVAFARYEDLHHNPIVEFTRLASAAGLPATQEDIVRAVAAAQFDRLRQEEESSGFRERPPTSSTFFRTGKPKSWEGILDDTLRDRLVRDHGPMMERLGYLPDGSAVRMPRRVAAR